MLDHVEGRNVVVSTRGGHVIEHAAEDAQKLADALNCEVTLVHNDTHVYALPGGHFEGIIEDWWEQRNEPL